LNGIMLSSQALPGIRDVNVEPDIDVDQLPDEYDENLQKTIELHNSVRWTGKTIGPKAPPKTFVASDFVNYLISVKEQSVTIGWIKDPGLANSLDVKLNDAKKKIAAGDSKTAKNVLGAFQSELTAQNGKQVSTEAYGLLFFNAQYLIDHL